MYKRMAVLLVLMVACKGPEGPAGPVGPAGAQGLPGVPGPAGPPGQTRLNLTAPIDASGTATVVLPAAAGTLASPPSLACYLQQPGSTVWLAVNDGFSLTTPYCALTFSGTYSAVMNQGIVGWTAGFVVVY